MKKVKYLAMLLAAGMFAACSDNLEDAGAGNAGGTTPSTTEGYVKVAINMPTTSGGMSRVDDSNIFEDGTTNEYAVKNGILVFFTDNEGAVTPENSATFVKAYPISLSNPSDGNVQVTTRYSYIGEAPMPNDGKQIYALAILNNNGLFSVSDGKLQIKDDASTESKDVFSTDNMTLAELQSKSKITTTSSVVTNEGFMMLNAPLAKAANYSAITSLSDVQTLVPVTVYEDKQTAQDRPASDIYVERVVAKVTLSGFEYDAKAATDKYTLSVATSDNESPFNDDKVALQGWALNVTNKTTKAVRDVSSITTWISSDYGTDNRFIGTNNIDGNNLYRIYWGIDNNYTGTYTVDNEFNIYTTDASITWNDQTSDANTEDNDHALYCLENTMDYGNQNQDQTTTVIIKTKYAAFPTEKNPYASFFMYGAQQKTYNVDDFIDNVEKTLDWETTHNGETLTINTTADGGTYTYATTIPTGQYNITSLFTITGGSATALTTDEAQKVYNALGNIRYYKDGASYYNTVLIRHFDDTNTDVVWNPSDRMYTQKHLGRYGVLRNNWYEIKVTGISGPGAPSIEDPDPNPDDETEGYIQTRINVLSWAKRNQDVEL